MKWVMVLLLGFSMALFSQESNLEKGVRIGREADELSAVVRKFEKLHTDGDFVGMGELIREGHRKKYDADVESQDSMLAGIWDEPKNSSYEIFGPIMTFGSDKSVRAVIRCKVTSGDVVFVRSYFMRKEAGGWRIHLVSPSKLDRFFDRVLDDGI